MTARINASPWGWIAIGAAAVSLVGYVVQTILDFVPTPAMVGEYEFYVDFAGFGLIALLAGVVSIATGWHHHSKHSIRLGFVAIAYVALAQLIQTLWD